MWLLILKFISEVCKKVPFLIKTRFIRPLGAFFFLLFQERVFEDVSPGPHPFTSGIFSFFVIVSHSKDGYGIEMRRRVKSIDWRVVLYQIVVGSCFGQ